MQFGFALLIFFGLAMMTALIYGFWGSHSISRPWILDSGPSIAIRLRRRHLWPFSILLVLTCIVLAIEMFSQGFHDFVANLLERLAGFFSSDPLDRGPVSIVFFSLVFFAILGGMLMGSWITCRRFKRMNGIGFIDLIMHWKH
jgi:hypothetical protein